MTALTSQPTHAASTWQHLRAMACDVTFQVAGPGPRTDEALRAAADAVRAVESACTRFDPDSPLMRANAEPDAWHTVPQVCFDVIAAAAVAHLETGGRFDPRVHDALVAHGYDRSLPFADGVNLPASAAPADAAGLTVPWVPGLDRDRCAVRLGEHRIDLGGIGKGFAVDLAATALTGVGDAALVEAGGDCRLLGAGPDGAGWRVGVEDPHRDGDPVAVLRLADRAVATSSVRLRHWRIGETAAHHLIDPVSGSPARSGLASVTVIGTSAAHAEVWSKALFICGADGIEHLAAERGLAALWVTEAGELRVSPEAEPFVMWRA